jgi:hypothetical protein
VFRTSIAAVAVLDQRGTVEAFRRAGATSPAHAKTLGEVGITDGRRVERLEKLGVLRDIGGRHYFLDEPSWRALRVVWRRVGLGVVLIVGAVLLGLFWSPANPLLDPAATVPPPP